MNTLLIGFIASLLAGLATVVGALPILLPIALTQRFEGIMLGFGGGVMLAATAFSLIVPGTETASLLRRSFANAQGSSQIEAAMIMVLGILLGGVFLQLAHRLLPHEHFFKRQEIVKK